MSSNQNSCVVVKSNDYNIFGPDDYNLTNELDVDFTSNELIIRNPSLTRISDPKGITGIRTLEDVKNIFGSNTDVSMNIILTGKYLSGEAPPPTPTGNSIRDAANSITYTSQKQFWDRGIRKLYILKNTINNTKVVDISGSPNVVYMLDFKPLQNQNTFNDSMTIYSGPISNIPSKIYLTNVVSKTLPSPWTNVKLEGLQIKINYSVNLCQSRGGPSPVPSPGPSGGGPVPVPGPSPSNGGTKISIELIIGVSIVIVLIIIILISVIYFFNKKSN